MPILIHEAEGGGIPAGCILLWSGAANSIPGGWALCNGSNGTPDLRNRFVVGAGSTYAVGATGGADTVALTTAQMPSHNHTFTGKSHTHSATLNLSGLTAASSGEHTHTTKIRGLYSKSVAVDGGNNVRYSRESLVDSSDESSTSSSDGAHTHSITGSGSVTVGSATQGGTVGSTGSGSGHENRPPYYALCYIMKL